MAEGLEYMIYGTSLAIGLVSGALGKYHRGDVTFDAKRGVNVAKGNGLASKIIKKFPSYSKVAPIIDHVLAGIAVPTSFAGASGLIAQTGIDLKAFTPPESYDLMKPFQFGTATYLLGELAWEGTKFIGKKMKAETGDLLQYATDASTPILVLYLANTITNSM